MCCSSRSMHAQCSRQQYPQEPLNSVTRAYLLRLKCVTALRTADWSPFGALFGAAGIAVPPAPTSPSAAASDPPLPSHTHPHTHLCPQALALIGSRAALQPQVRPQ
jgi:hypothetical protein